MDVNKVKKQIIAASGALEAYISIIILIAIAGFSINIIIDVVKIIPAFFTTADSFFVEQFLGRSLQLVIALEFVKMIANQTPGSTIEVLIFAIARSIIVSHDNPLHELLFGIIAIAILFFVRKFANSYDRKVRDNSILNVFNALKVTNNHKGKVVSGDILVSTVNQLLNHHIPARSTDTIGFMVESCIKSKKGSVQVGDSMEIEGITIKVNKIENEKVIEVELD